jgi:hypothetical protein
VLLHLMRRNQVDRYSVQIDVTDRAERAEALLRRSRLSETQLGLRPRLFIACVISIPILTPTLRSAKKSSSPNGREAHNFAIAASRSSSLRLTGETWSGLLGKQGIRHHPFCPPRVNISVGQTFRPGARQDGGSFAAQNLGADLSRNHLDMLPSPSIFVAFRIGIGSRLRSTIMKRYRGILEKIGGPAWVLVLEDR